MGNAFLFYANGLHGIARTYFELSAVWYFGGRWVDYQLNASGKKDYSKIWTECHRNHSVLYHLSESFEIKRIMFAEKIEIGMESRQQVYSGIWFIILELYPESWFRFTEDDFNIYVHEINEEQRRCPNDS